MVYINIMNPPLPTHSQHTPVFTVSNTPIDGPYANATDCPYLSVGYAQYDSKRISGKTYRHNGRRWNRNSEEMPVHRILDLAAMIAAASTYHANSHVSL